MEGSSVEWLTFGHTHNNKQSHDFNLGLLTFLSTDLPHTDPRNVESK